MQIKKIKLTQGGFKGAEVTYLRPEKKGSRTFINEVIEKRKNPIQEDLEKPFRDLRFHLLEICGLIRGDMEKMDIDYTIGDTEIIELSFTDTSFQLTGEKKTGFGNKSFKIKTPNIEDADGYHFFDTVMKMVEKIIEETELYMNGTKVVKDEEVAIRWIEAGKSKEVDADKFSGMSAEEKKEFCKKVLEEEFGAIVTDVSDFEFANDVEEVTPLMIETVSSENTESKEDSKDVLDIPEMTIGEGQTELVIDLPAKKK